MKLRTFTSKWYFVGCVLLASWLYIKGYEKGKAFFADLSSEPSDIESAIGTFLTAVYLTAQVVDKIDSALLWLMCLMGISYALFWAWDKWLTSRGRHMIIAHEWCALVEWVASKWWVAGICTMVVLLLMVGLVILVMEAGASGLEAGRFISSHPIFGHFFEAFLLFASITLLLFVTWLWFYFQSTVIYYFVIDKLFGKPVENSRRAFLRRFTPRK